MQGKQFFDSREKVEIDLESFVPQEHPLRRVNRVLDLSFLRELTTHCYADGLGRPSIDPEVFFRMLLVAYLNNITKDRRLCEDDSLQSGLPLVLPVAIEESRTGPLIDDPHT